MQINVFNQVALDGYHFSSNMKTSDVWYHYSLSILRLALVSAFP